MSDELKTQVDDLKDNAHIALLDTKVKARGLKSEQTAADRLHTAEDQAERLTLDTQIKARDAQHEVNKTDTKRKLDDAVTATGDKLEDAKDSVKNKLSGESEHTIAARDQVKEADRQARDRDVQKERERQAMVDNVKAHVILAKDKVVAGASAVGAAITHAFDKTKDAAHDTTERAKDERDLLAAKAERNDADLKVEAQQQKLDAKKEAREAK